MTSIYFFSVNKCALHILLTISGSFFNILADGAYRSACKQTKNKQTNLTDDFMQCVIAPLWFIEFHCWHYSPCICTSWSQRQHLKLCRSYVVTARAITIEWQPWDQSTSGLVELLGFCLNCPIEAQRRWEYKQKGQATSRRWINSCSAASCTVRPPAVQMISFIGQEIQYRPALYFYESISCFHSVTPLL